MQSRSERTRTRILEAARKEFSLHGFEATGVAEICESAGVSKGAFYHHFPTKQAAFLELLHTWLANVEEQLQATSQASRSVPVALQEMSSMVGQVFQAAGDQLPLFLEFWTQSSRDPQIWQATIAPYHRYQQFFAALLSKGVDEGSIHSGDVDNASRLIVSLAVGTIFQGLLDPHGADWEAVSRFGMQVLLEGLRGRSA